MSLATLREQLIEVNKAITRVLTNQEYSINGRSFKMADLGQLREWRAELNREIKAYGADSTGVADADNVSEALVMFLP